MILRKISYHEFDGKPNYWGMKDLTLEKINLLVGKNATGKTNIITKITWLGNMLAGLQPQLLNSGNYDVEFSDEDNTYQYKLKLSLQKVEFEELIINNASKFKRESNGIGKIFSTQFKTEMDFHLPPNQLVVVSKRDAIQHPFLEELATWAEGMRMYAFGSALGKDSGFFTININQLIVDPRDPNQVASLYVKGKQEFANDFKGQIISYMKAIDYDLVNINVAPDPSIILPLSTGGQINMIYISEKDSAAVLRQSDISQGMFRALSLIIQLTYNILKKSPTTILIDDIGEGLDFDRSSKLIQLLIDLAKRYNIQLIMSTNDRFVMNNVPLEYWQVIQRKGGECQVSNYQNSKDKFDEFEYTGLNNFDFLRTDFINSSWEPV